jgi:hypothetical protein
MRDRLMDGHKQLDHEGLAGNVFNFEISQQKLCERLFPADKHC